MATFIAVVEGGSFTAAAKVLGLRQPTVSRRVAELEDALGVALIQRSTRSLALTEAGYRYLEQARVAMLAVASARDAARGPQELSGLFRLSAPVSFTEAWLSPRLPGFLESHPGLHIDLELSERHVDLVSEGVDVALRIGGPASATLTGRRLRPVERWFVVSPGWLAKHGRPQNSAELSRHTGLIFAATGTRPRQFRLAEGPPVAPARVVTSTNGQPLLQLARDGLGVALLPDWLVKDALSSGELVRVLPEARMPRLELWVVWPRHRYQRAVTRSFVDWVIGAAQSEL